MGRDWRLNHKDFWQERETKPEVRSNRIVLIGDSITANNDESPGSASNTSATGKRGYFTKLNVLLYQRFKVVNYAGVDGNTTTQMLARFTTDVLDYSPNYVWIFGGTNDTEPVSVTIANITSMADKAIDSGITPIISTILPRSVVVAGVVTGATTGSFTALAQVFLDRRTQANEAIRSYCSRDNGAILIDWTAVFIADDSLVNSETFLPRNLYTQDGVHPSALGAVRLAEYCFTVLDSIVPKMTSLIGVNTNSARTGGDSNNCVQNGLFIQGAGGTVSTGATGTPATDIAEGWRAVREGGTIAGVVSKVARTDNVGGEWQRAVVTGGGANDVFRFDQTSTVAISTMGWVEGDTIVMEAEVRISGVTGRVSHCGLEVTVTATVAENHQAQFKDLTADTTDGQFSQGLLRTKPFVLPAGATAVLPQLEMSVQAGDATFDWGSVRCWKIEP